MELTITEQTEKPLLKRNEVTARIHYDASTPSRDEIAKALAEKLGVKRELLLVTRVGTAFGDTAAKVEARVYTDKDAMAAIEEEYVRTRNVIPEEPEAPAEEKAEAPAEEAAEESAEEAPAEESAEPSEEDKE